MEQATHKSAIDARYADLCKRFAQTKGVESIHDLYEAWLAEHGQEIEALIELWMVLDIYARWLPDWGHEEEGEACFWLKPKLGRYVDEHIANRGEWEYYFDTISQYE